MTQADKPLGDSIAAMALMPTNSPSLEAYFQEKLGNIRRALPEAARQLKEAGVKVVLVNYDGCGDSGQIESVTYLGAGGKAVDLTAEVTITEEHLTDLFYDLLETRHPGWENNDGAWGEFQWNLSSDELHHSHNERFTDYDTTEHDGV
jgi:hypothetical protein